MAQKRHVGEQRTERLQPPADHPQPRGERRRLLRVRGRPPQQQRAVSQRRGLSARTR